MNMLHIIEKMFLIFLFILKCEICAMEKDDACDVSPHPKLNSQNEDFRTNSSIYEQQSSNYVRTIPHPGCLPVRIGSFECFRSRYVYPNAFLANKYSKDIRMTYLNLLALVDYTPGEYFQDKFAELEGPIKKCIPVCDEWKHVARHLFHGLGELCETRSKKKQRDIKVRVTTLVTNFVESLKQTKNVDGLEMQLLSIREHTGVDMDHILSLVRKLRRHKSDHVAVHYLYSFARQVPNLQDSTYLCAIAQRLDIYPGQAYRVMKPFWAGKSIITTRSIPTVVKDNIPALEAALRYMPLERFDSTFVFSLVDHLTQAKRKEAAIHYLLSIADRYSSRVPERASRSSYLVTKAYYNKAEKLGSGEATRQKYKLKQAFLKDKN